MVEISRFWDGSSVGDATVAPYDAGTEFSKVLMSLSGAAGIATNLSAVFRGELNELAVTGAVSPASVNTGRAIVWGAWYENGVATTVAIPTPSGATRIDRLVLRKDWAAQTVRITRIAGVEGGAAPALVQIEGTTWDEPIAQVSITTGGAMTLTDQRAFVGGAGMPTPSGTNSILTSTGGVAAWSATPTIGGVVTISTTAGAATGSLIINNISDTNIGPIIITRHESASPATNDILFRIYATGRTSTAVLINYGIMTCQLGDPTNATASSYWIWQAYNAGASVNVFAASPAGSTFYSGGLTINGTTTFTPVATNAVFTTTTQATNAAYGTFINSGGTAYFGIDSSTSVLFAGVAYATGINCPATFVLRTLGVNAITVATTGIVTFPVGSVNSVAGAADATNYTLYIMSAGNGALITEQSRFNVYTQTAITVAKQIAVLPTYGGGVFLVSGSDGAGNSFTDLVVAGFAGTPVAVASNTSFGAPTARTYSISGTTLRVAMASGTYTTRVTSLIQDRRS